jgi:hypothetical protein
MNKVIVFLEKMWLVVAISCLGVATYMWIMEKKEDSYYFLMFACLASVLFFLRRRTRKHMAQMHKPKDS